MSFYLRKNRSSMNPGQLTLLASTFCVMLTMHFSGQLLAEHLLIWKKPKEQKAIIIIILMAPIYAIDSFAGLVDFQGSKAFFMLLESVKECYEALVIAKFLALLYCYLNISISKNIVPDEIKGREIHHSFPMTLFQHNKHRGIRNVKLSLIGVEPNFCYYASIQATRCSFEPPRIKAPEVLDMAVCCDSPYLLHLDDISSTSWVVFQLGKLDIHNYFEYFSITRFVFSGGFLSCVYFVF
ncbi:hypothetical protein POTOM_003101 [Populus tomentosa]|uniref:Uncharacterized protein n=1 Tax=Populus tomentosa TaxID=118781 RepID=A0A8X8IYK3_POPTO|nr:hypothetical protein POTOM_003101 [Populus tomentosa]